MPFLKHNAKKIPRSRALEALSFKNGWRPAVFNSKGDKYVGNWVNNEKKGFGLLTTKSGYLYDGNWSEDLRHKLGISARANDCHVFEKEYQGNWRCGEANGLGEKHFKDGGFYKGYIRKNKREGIGLMWYSDGSFYHGNWENDKREGFGVFVLVNGNRYEGKWEKDMKHGKGKYYHFHTGQMQQGVWVKDNCVISLLEDIPFRQAAVSPTKYPIPKIEVVNYKMVYGREEDMWNCVVEQDYVTYLSYSTL